MVGQAATEKRYIDKPLVEWRIAELGLKKQQVAAFVGVSPGQFSRLLSGERNISDVQLDRLGLAVGLPIDLLLTRREAAA